jgi:hypothetical protein
MAKKVTTETNDHSPKFDKVKKYYDDGLWTKEMVYNMVTNPKSKPWITAEEYEEITGEPYEA